MRNTIPFSPHALGSVTLSNRIVMAPMSRSRAIGNLPNDIMATYYSQRATAGLIITEGVSPSINGLGYARMPGIYSPEQTKAWRKITEAVHNNGGKIFLQIMHAGRIAHQHNLPQHGRVIAPSSVRPAGQMWTDQEGLKKFTVPQELTLEELHATKDEFVQAARNAMDAGFDGIELHGANGYLLEQFLSPHTNKRKDDYGGSVENRTRFVLEVTKAVGNAIGKENTGIRLSPYSVYNDMAHYPEIDTTYLVLAEKLNDLGIVYIHFLDHSGNESPEVFTLKNAIRNKFKNNLILTGGYDFMRASHDLSAGLTDLVGFGKPFITNPDLLRRFRKNLPLNIKLDASTLYTPGHKGYTDYPVFEAESVSIY